MKDRLLPEHNRGHSLGSHWLGYRQCHIKPDLLLIYRQSGTDILRLARLGPHR